MPNTLASLLEFVRSVSRLPQAELEFRTHMDPDNVGRVFRHFTKRHPRYFVIRNKTIGAALVDLRRFGSGSDYLSAVKGRNSAEHHARRARSRGYKVVEIDRNDYIDDIHHINTSVELRQGKPMSETYRNKQTHYAADRNFRYYGTLDTSGRLVAYGEIGLWGNFAAFDRIIGIRNNDGIMHLMVTEIICQFIEDGRFHYLMYDTYFGASPGLKTFKTALGFTPYRARYRLL
jgi:hypothetical protein